MQRPPTHKEIAQFCCETYSFYLPKYETFTGAQFADIIRKYMEDNIRTRIMLSSIQLYVVSIEHNYMGIKYKMRVL